MYDAIRQFLPTINSLTKFPSIPTYHDLQKDGTLGPDHVQFPLEQQVHVTEKINGVNARIIQFPGGPWIIGSREDLLTARGDLIRPVAHSIPEQLIPVAQRIAMHFGSTIRVYYFEVHGRDTVKAGAHYGAGWRLIDVCHINDAHSRMTWSPQEAAEQRHAIQEWMPWDDVILHAGAMQLPLVPALATMLGRDLPQSVTLTHIWLNQIAANTTLMPHLGGAIGSPAGPAEGVVLRLADGSLRAKVRHNNYQRTKQVAEARAAAEAKTKTHMEAVQ